MKPNMVIIPGAQKSGTSSCFHYLSQHPNCIPSEPKEPSFFSKKENLDHFDDYWQHFPNSVSHNSSDDFFLEASTGYMVEEYVPERIDWHLGENVKFIFLLRDPVERAISAYWHLYERNLEQRSLEEVFLNLPNQMDGPAEVCQYEGAQISEAVGRDQINPAPFAERYDDSMWPFYYLYNSCYSYHINRFFRFYPPDQFMLINFRYFIEQNEQCMETLLEFIGVGTNDFEFDDEIHNKTRVPRGAFRSFRLERVVPTSIKTLLKKIGLKSLYHRFAFSEKPETSESIRQHVGWVLSDELEFLRALETVSLGSQLDFSHD